MSCFADTADDDGGGGGGGWTGVAVRVSFAAFMSECQAWEAILKIDTEFEAGCYCCCCWAFFLPMLLRLTAPSSTTTVLRTTCSQQQSDLLLFTDSCEVNPRAT